MAGVTTVLHSQIYEFFSQIITPLLRLYNYSFLPTKALICCRIKPCISTATANHIAHMLSSYSSAGGHTISPTLTEADWFASDANINWRRAAETIKLKQQKKVASGKEGERERERDLTFTIRDFLYTWWNCFYWMHGLIIPWSFFNHY